MSYEELVKSLTPQENKWKNGISAFLSGGTIGLISEILVRVFNVETMLVIWILIAAIITGFGIFDNVVDKIKMGAIIPITGFSHSVSASSIEYKRDGLITGIGSNYLKLAGSVILYGIVSSSILSLIRGLIWLV